MVTKRTITSYFAPKKRERIVEDSDNAEPIEVSDRDEPIVEPNVDCTANEQPPSEEGVGVDFLMRDPGLRKQIETYDSDEKDLIRREYIDFGPYQPKLAKYPYSGPEKHPRRFQKKDMMSVLARLIKGIFLEMLKLLASYNKEVDSVVLDNAPKNAKYTSPLSQKEILHVYASKVQSTIRKEIGDAKFCLIVDESRDISKREQMALVVRYVDKSGFVRECFLDLVHVKDTTSKTLKNEICAALSHHDLSLQNLALVAAAREVPQIHTFFQQLIFVVNVVTSSTKRHDELQETQLAEIQHLVEIEGLETGKGLNQIGTLQRPCDTRWSSHYRSICSLLRMYRASRSVLDDIASEGTTYAQRGDALNGVKLLMSFEFVFNLHVVKEIMAITDGLCQALQLKTQDVVNAMHLVSTTKTLLQNLRNDGWVSLWSNVRQFCEIYDVAIPDMNAPSFDVLKSIRRQSRQKDIVTMEHHYRVDIFFAAID
ncbi:uncharacterized protein LOC110702344 [Chenopodium quinoa]|uniref:uncharacterized protein LOC110702344 n=1 Tax=Chenopodium quinoa TaxID=63459 RepID=UPI000B76E4DA|nr:uncharacterized protein LOC110702344 [Chenopodium quinoa]